MLSFWNQGIFRREIYPGCAIGPGIFFPHTSGTEIHASKTGGKAAASWADLEVGSTDIGNDLVVRV
jgi:serine acetyltransferase